MNCINCGYDKYLHPACAFCDVKVCDDMNCINTSRRCTDCYTMCCLECIKMKPTQFNFDENINISHLSYCPKCVDTAPSIIEKKTKF
jgi:hypothetical protein